MRALVALAPLGACALILAEPRPLPAPPVFSPCGVRLVGSDDVAGYIAAETAIMHELERHVPGACANLAGWVVIVRPTAAGWWEYDSPVQGKTRVIGLASCAAMTIEIGTAVWWQSALAHEFIHAAAECTLPDGGRWVNWQHEGWPGSWKARLHSDVTWPP